MKHVVLYLDRIVPWWLCETQKQQPDLIRCKPRRLSFLVSKGSSNSLTSFFEHRSSVWEPLRIKKETNYTVREGKKAVKLVLVCDDLKVAQWCSEINLDSSSIDRSRSEVGQKENNCVEIIFKKKKKIWTSSWRAEMCQIKSALHIHWYSLYFGNITVW